MKSFLLKYRWYVLMNIFSMVVIIGSIWYVVKPVALPEPATREEIETARQQGLEWLVNNFSDGLFRYEFDPELNKTPQSSNELRQLMASRVAAAEAKADETFAQIHAENLAFVLEYWYQEDERGGYVLVKDKSKLGGNAMLLRTLVHSPHFEDYQSEARMLVQGITALQNDNGSFMPWYVEPDYEYDADYLLNFYSGEALLALLEYYEKTGEEVALEAATKGAEFYLTHYVENMEENYHPAYVPWHTMAYTKLYEVTGEERYVEAIYTMNDRLIELLDKTNIPGRFYKRELAAEGQQAPHSSSDAVYLEGLIYAYELARDGGEVERAERYEEAIGLSITRLVNLQYKNPNADFLADPVTYVGAIPVRESNPIIRVDTTQHALDAMEKYLAVFGKE